MMQIPENAVGYPMVVTVGDDPQEWIKYNLSRPDQPNGYTEWLLFVRTSVEIECRRVDLADEPMWECRVLGDDPRINHYVFRTTPGKLLRGYLRYLAYLKRRDPMTIPADWS